METVLHREIIVSKTASRILGVAVVVVLMALSAFVRIPLPFTPVPITLQTFFAILSGAILGSRWGSLSQIAYAAIGAAGISVFTGSGSGAWYLLGPTGGYIAGFIAAAVVAGALARYRHSSFAWAFLVFASADIFLLLCGCLWLKILTAASWRHIAAIGFVPFLIGDMIKVMLAAALYTKFQARLRDLF